MVLNQGWDGFDLIQQYISWCHVDVFNELLRVLKYLASNLYRKFLHCCVLIVFLELIDRLPSVQAPDSWHSHELLNRACLGIGIENFCYLFMEIEDCRLAWNEDSWWFLEDQVIGSLWEDVELELLIIDLYYITLVLSVFIAGGLNRLSSDFNTPVNRKQNLPYCLW